MAESPEASVTRIAGRKFLEALRDAGIIRQGDFVSRVVIDAHIDRVVCFYVERFGDSRLLNVVTTLDGVEIGDRPRDAADVSPRHEAFRSYVTAGFTPESAFEAVNRSDTTLLRHTGVVHVQLEPPQHEGPDDGSAGVPAKV